MRKLLASALTVSICATAGCGIRPLPQDVTRYNTSDIVRHIRCETREAVRHQLLAWLDYQAAKHGDAAAGRIAIDIRADKDAASIDYSGLHEYTAKMINYFAQTAVAYSFTFDMTIANNNTVGVTLLDTFHSGGKGTLALGAGLNLSRNNVRALTVSDTFGSLYGTLGKAYCDGELKAANYIYPITGKIGMQEQVDSFVDDAVFNGLSAKEGAAQQTEADTLEFQTIVGGTVNPKIVLVGSNGVADAGYLGTLTRTDKHKVVIAFAVPVKGKGAGIIEEFVGKYISGSGNATQRRALRAIDQAKQDRFVDKLTD